MRSRLSADGLTVNAIAGTHVVVLGFDLPATKTKGLLGFAIFRTDHEAGESYWMSGMKTFQATDPGLHLGGQVSSNQHPFQSFWWFDYSAKPAHTYTYKVVAMRGTPQQLRATETVELTISTEDEATGTHAVFFNRGAVATQEYARRFQNKAPEEIGPAAYTWLSRGLVEALLGFIGQAKGRDWAIHAAVYEFQQPIVLNALAAAAKTGADVQIVYDDFGPGLANDKAIDAAGIRKLCTKRTKAKIAHNKFFILSYKGVPQQVWTGSTNLTLNGIYGHSNLGHIVRSPEIAAAYFDYWQQVVEDPETKALRPWTVAHTPAPPTPWSKPITPVFSPRSDLKALEWYRDLAAGAKRGLFMTFAFGMHPFFLDIYGRKDGVLRMALMEKAGMNKAQADAVQQVRRLPNTIVAVGNTIKTNAFDRWLAEKTKIDPNAHVLYIHTKYMLVDPLGPAPIVVSGSANFSKASTDTNDENMLVVHGDTRVADIYFGECMRLYSHYAFRDALAMAKARKETWNPSFLVPDDSWTRPFFQTGSPKALRRIYFAGSGV